MSRPYATTYWERKVLQVKVRQQSDCKLSVDATCGKKRLHCMYIGMESYQTCRLQTRRGCIYSFHSRYSLIVVDKPLRSNGKFWCVRNQILLPKDHTADLFEHLISTLKNCIWIIPKHKISGKVTLHFHLNHHSCWQFLRRHCDPKWHKQQWVLDAGQTTALQHRQFLCHEGLLDSPALVRNHFWSPWVQEHLG